MSKTLIALKEKKNCSKHCSYLSKENSDGIITTIIKNSSPNATNINISQYLRKSIILD